MIKEDALAEFLKGLRIVFNTGSAYPKDHPYFIKSVKEFKQKVDALFNFLNPIKINVTPESLFIDGQYWNKSIFYVEIAQLFHLRKIKSIEFRTGLTTEELIDFFSSVSLPIKEFLRKGIIATIVSRGTSAHILIEELDYSELLLGEGEEVKDIWVYLFGEAIKEKDFQKLNDFADKFPAILKNFKGKDFLEDKELSQNLHSFLSYLKENQQEKFYNCSKELFSSVLKYKDALDGQGLDDIKPLFKYLNEEELTDLLLTEIVNNDNFNASSFKLFSHLIDDDKHKIIAPLLLKKVKGEDSLKENPKIEKKVHDLLAAQDSQFMSEVYRNTLSAISRNISHKKGFSFDQGTLKENFLSALLNLLAELQEQETINLILEQLYKEWQEITQNRRLGYLRNLSEILVRKKQEPKLKDIFKELDMRFANFVENNIWENSRDSDLDYLASSLGQTSLDADFYFTKIFHENKITPNGLRLFLKFFPTQLPTFYKNLAKRESDIDFLFTLIHNMARLEPPLALPILKHMFSFVNELTKLEILKTIQGIPKFNPEFLLPFLRKCKVSLKKESLLVLNRDDKARREAFEMLLNIPSPLGIRNKILLENLEIIEELDLKEAKSYIGGLSKRRFFWNRDIRNRAGLLLEKWHDGTN